MINEAAKLANSLGGKLSGPHQWLAACPYHDDRSPSLSIAEGEDGRVLAYCHAGCDNVFEQLVRDGHLERPKASQGSAEPEACYQYLVSAGALAYETVRLAGKQFRARRPTSDSGQIWDVPAELRIPYRLPEVLQASADTPIFVVEGEKDADTLAAHGHIATTNPFGAGKWRSQYNQYFRSRHVVIIPDNDEPGRKHAESVKQQLEPVAASVRVMSLSGVVAEKGDVSDLIAEGGIDSFTRLLDQLPPPDVRLKPYLTIRDLARLPRRTWLVEGLMPHGGVVLLYGDSGVGKSFIAIDASVRIAVGESVFDRATVSGLVFYVSLEGQAGLADRLRAVCEEIGVSNEDHLPLVVGNKTLDLLNPDSVSELIRGIGAAAADHQKPVKLVVIDTLARAMPGADENSPGDMNRAVSGFTRIQHETGATVLVIHHSGKTPTKGPRGHSSLRAAVDAELLVGRDKAGRTLTVTKQRDGADLITMGFELVTRSVPAGKGELLAQTLVVHPLGNDRPEPATRLKPTTQKALKALKEALRTSGRILNAEDADGLQVPRGIRVVTRDAWLDACRTAGFSKGTDGAVRKAQNRAARELRDAGLLGEGSEYVWLPPPGSSGDSGQTEGTGTGQDSSVRPH